MVSITLRECFFKLRYGLRGYPRQVGHQTFRFDESLRRWNFDGEQEVREALTQHLHAGETAIDTGANFGMHTLIMADRIGPDGRLLAFEPIPENLRLLRRNVKLNGFDDRVTIEQAAISDQAVGTIEMVVDSDQLEPSASLQTDATRGRETVRVKNISLDEATSSVLAGEVCLVKMDVEGAELSVLRSGQRFLERVKPKLLIEVHDYALPQFGDSAPTVYEFLTNHGYSIEPISDMRNHNGEYHHVMAVPQ